ncbi:cytochrome c oxidase assembly factor Coa1 family protein [Kordia sp.]|uniref:cytochrome c oxidase assembly factor Coa1 family protein n=1 Tax=Kordia sp. TaxID=1965332 RepID=UPI003B5A9333
MNRLEAHPNHQPRKNWWQRNWKWFVPTGCLSIIALFVIFIIAIFFTVTSFIKKSTPYKDAFDSATTNEYVIEILGKPIEQEGMLQGNISIQNNTGEANISFPVEGPNGSGTVYVVGQKYNGTWTYDKMTIYIDSSNETIDLLQEQ